MSALVEGYEYSFKVDLSNVLVSFSGEISYNTDIGGFYDTIGIISQEMEVFWGVCGLLLVVLIIWPFDLLW